MRSIPACTGEPHLYEHIRLFDQVYPRVYGGTQSKKSREYVKQGLSPRVRGNPTRVAN